MSPSVRVLVILFRGLLAYTIFLISLPAMAGDVSFRLSLADSTLIVTPLGESQVFYPAVLRLLPDGSWKPLVSKLGLALPAEMVPEKEYSLEWTDTRPLQSLPPFERLQPVMVRYFELDGVGFGQITFFHMPPTAIETLQAGYANGLLVITPPEAMQHAATASNAIRATWVLWPQEEGIALIHEQHQFEHVQPAAQRIEWKPGARALHINTGKGQPEVFLLHETDQGYVVQLVAGSGLQGRQQRAGWLDACTTFYTIAFLFALAAMITLLLYLVRTKRINTST